MTQPRPDFSDIEEEADQTPSISSYMPTITTTAEQEIMERTLHGGSVMIHQRSSILSSSVAGSSHAVIPINQPEQAIQQHMFIQEDEMATWLQHNLDSSFDRDLFADLIYSAPPPISVISPPRREILPNFAHYARLGIRPRVAEPMVVTTVTTVVESNEMQELGQSSQTTGFDKMVTGTGEGTMGSSASGSVILLPENPASEEKGKAKESDDSQSEIGLDSESVETKKQGRSPVSKKRQRVAEVHNLSERKRRDRINERIRTLQELVPGCHKLDKASILDDAIEYLKSMQLQLQTISMGCGMFPNPMMFPGMQQYMPTMGMGMAHMGMALNMPILPYPYQTILPTSTGRSQVDTAEPRFSAQALNPSRIQASDQADLMLSLLAGQSPSMHQPMPNYLNPYQQQFLALQHAAQVSSAQTQGLVQPSGNKPSSSKDIDSPDNRKTGP